MSELIHEIARDLVIYPFDNEGYEEYGNRIIYSALATWGKLQVLGKSYTELDSVEEDYFSVSQRYITEKLKFVSEGLIKGIVHSKEWINDDDTHELGRDISRYITENLIYCFQLSKISQNQRITALPQKIVDFKNNQLILGGTNWNSNSAGAYSVGLGVWQNKEEKCDDDYKKVFNIPQCNLKEYYDSIVINAKWNKAEIVQEDYEYFTAGMGLWHSKAWAKFNEKSIPEGISILRKINQKYNYCLLRKVEGDLFTAKLDEWYKKENEIRRIMYALDYNYKKPAIFNAKRREKVIELHCHSKLPNAESRILLMASWPKRKYDDIFLKEIPECLWEDIEYMLNELGVKVVFK